MGDQTLLRAYGSMVEAKHTHPPVVARDRKAFLADDFLRQAIQAKPPVVPNKAKGLALKMGGEDVALSPHRNLRPPFPIWWHLFMLSPART